MTSHLCRSRRSFAVRFLALFATAALLFSLASPASAATRSELRARTDLYFSMTLPTFMKYSAAHAGSRWRGLDWSNDGCSAPTLLPSVGSWNAFFKDSCVRHDFGYRNYGSGLALTSTNNQKKLVDDRFLADMNATCKSATKRPLKFSVSACQGVAGQFYDFVRTSAAGRTSITNPENSWHARKCTAGALCLFDDREFSDRRLTFGNSNDYPADFAATTIPDMNTVGFGDKTSSVWNRSPYAWRLFDDHSYRDRSVCVAAGQKIANLGLAPRRFGDKTSSIKRLATASC